ncbi:MAG: FkbM family methyltransferase, partial [Acidimicrobiales bacterium]
AHARRAAPLAGVAARLKRLASPGRGDLHTVRFVERGRQLAVYVPDEEILTLCRELILDRVYERCGLSLADCTGTVVDAGAHVGVFSLRAARWARRVVSIEADPVNLAVLELNLRRNAVTNVAARQAALWHEPSPDLLLTASHHSGGGVVAAGERRADAPAAGPRPGGTPLEAVTLDQLVEELGPIDLLKLDVEGAEFEVLGRSRRLDQVRRIAGEVHLDDEHDDRLATLTGRLRRAGFDVDVVDEAELLSGAESRRRLWSNWRSLEGELATKLLVAGYLLAPVRKPLRRAGATHRLPILLAQRPGAD